MLHLEYRFAEIMDKISAYKHLTCEGYRSFYKIDKNVKCFQHNFKGKKMDSFWQS